MRAIHASLLLPLFLLASPVHADEAVEVEAATVDLYERLNAGDAKGFGNYLLPGGFTEFNNESAELLKLDLDFFKRAMTSGARIDLHASDIKVNVLGKVAIATGHRTGAITLPDGKRIDSRMRLTMVWSQQAGGWKLQHVHLSDTGEARRG
ncbi:nuclear transport factor 2 family protein [Chitinimonas sp.]|uniref:YybH family protein n=1 Tax=Chitinimonas sp. TaxID=1934313 RepID=UPI0035AEBFA4